MEHVSEDILRARTWRTAHEAEEGSEELPLEFLFGFYETMRELNEQINHINACKRSMFEGVRANYGRHYTEALKITMREIFTDPRKRAERKIFNEAASRYIDRIESEIEARQYDS